MKVRTIWWICLGTGLLGTLLPMLLMELSPGSPTRGGAVERTLSVLVGPGVMIAGSLFNIHSLAFVVLALSINFAFWSAVSLAAVVVWARLRRNAH